MTSTEFLGREQIEQLGRRADAEFAEMARVNALPPKPRRRTASTPPRTFTPLAVATAPPPALPTDSAAAAEREWDYNPAVRAGFSSRESYLAYRQAESAGRVRVYSGGGVAKIGSHSEWLKADELLALPRRIAQQRT